jgi:uroporphyrinogen-III synthase
MWAHKAIDVVVVTSNDGLQNLYDMLGEAGRAHLLATPLVAVSARGAGLARDLGFQHIPQIASGASDEAIVAALIRWREGQREAHRTGRQHE